MRRAGLDKLTDLEPGSTISSTLNRVKLVLGLLLLGWVAAGCLTPFEQDSNWRWKQFSPEYREPLPPAE